MKYLGVQIDDDLSGTSIVKETIKKANTRLKFPYRHKNMLNFECRKTLCSALIQCHFDYFCSWYPGINKELRDKLRILDNGNEQLVTACHVFKIKTNTTK